MMYNEKFSVAIRNRGNTLREDKDIVYLPFGTEYSIYLKNHETRRAVAKIEIDGKPVSVGGVVVDANGSVDIERFIKDNDRGNRFKFIERTSAIEDHRGVGAEDGIVRIEFDFERAVVPVASAYPMNNQWPYYPPGARGSSKGGFDAVSYNTSDVTLSHNVKARSVTRSAASPQSENGITVAGSESTQRFTTVGPLQMENNPKTIVMRLLGVMPNAEPIQQVIPAREKIECGTCGKKNKSSASFCSRCGTAVHIY